MSVLETITIDGKTHELPSGASVDVDGDKLVISNHGIPSSSTVNIANFEYSEDERIVGCWTDGKPIYEKTIVMTSPPDSAYIEKPLPITDSETIIHLEIFIDRQNGDFLFNFSNDSTGFFEVWVRNSNHTKPNMLCVNLTRTAYQNKPMYVIIQYTKTTDAPNSFTLDMLGIKQLKPKHNYSTEEQVVGTWIDGKPIYERAILLEITEVHSSVFDTLLQDNVDMLVNEKITYRDYGRTAVSAQFVLCNAEADNAWYNTNLLVLYDNGNLVARFDKNKGSLLIRGFIQYTKTTD